MNFSLIGSGLGLGLLATIFSWSFQPFLSSILGFVIGVIIGYVMFFAGQWGGGDAKMIMGLGALFGLDLFVKKEFPVLLLFLINTVLVGAAYGLFWMVALIIKNGRKVFFEWKKLIHSKEFLKRRRVSLIISVLLIIIVLIIPYTPLKVMLGIIACFVFFLVHLWALTKVVEQVCMVKDINTKKLTEGDWIVKDVWVPKKNVESLGEFLSDQQEKKKEQVLREHTWFSLCSQLNWSCADSIKKNIEQKYSLSQKELIKNAVASFVKKEKFSQADVLKACASPKALKTFDKKQKTSLEEFLRKEVLFSFSEEFISGPKDLGIAKEQIKRLKELRIKTVAVKEGIPFVPSFLLAYFVTVWLGNWFLLVL